MDIGDIKGCMVSLGLLLIQFAVRSHIRYLLAPPFVNHTPDEDIYRFSNNDLMAASAWLVLLTANALWA